jgi:hypothetical protein
MKPKPCPCCGNKRLYVGVTAHCEMGVQCEPIRGGCGLRMLREWPDRYPRGVKTLRAFKHWVLQQVIEAWNRRV